MNECLKFEEKNIINSDMICHIKYIYIVKKNTFKLIRE